MRSPLTQGQYGARADWRGRGRVSHGLRAYGPWPLRWLTPTPLRFAILTNGRSGSELLVSLLDAHPQIVCDGEILAIRRLSTQRLLEARAALAAARGARAYGFKLLRSHLLIQSAQDPADRLRALVRDGFRMIRLERRDMLQQALSYLAAENGGYHHRRGDSIRFAPARVEPTAVIALMHALEEASTFARQALADTPHLELLYEDDLLDHDRQQQTVERVCAFLGLRSQAVASDLVKIAPNRTRALVENYDELEAALTGTRFAGYLEMDGH